MAAVGLRRFGAPLVRPTRKLVLPRWSTAAGVAQVPVNEPETKLTQLSNGLTVASQDNKGLSTCTVGLWISSGSRMETRDTNGVGNFVKQMLFKGTKRRTQAQLQAELKSISGGLNAYTTREQTAYYTRTVSKDLPKAVDILSDIVQNPTLDEKEIDKERKVISEELEELECTINKAIFEYIYTIVYEGSSMAWLTLGPPENIAKFSRQDLVDYMSTHYTAPQMVLAAAGDVNHEELVALAEKQFAGLPSSNKPLDVEPCRFIGSELRIRDDDMPYCHVLFAVEGVGWTHPDYLPLMVARELVGDWDRVKGYKGDFPNRLVRHVSPGDAARSFKSFYTPYTDTGIWGIYFVSDPKQVDNFVWNIKEEWHRMASGVSNAEVARAKKSFKESLVQQLDGSTPICDHIGRQILQYGRSISLSEWFDRIEQVDSKAVTDAMDEHLFDKCPGIVGIGQTEDLNDYSRYRADMRWRRL